MAVNQKKISQCLNYDNDTELPLLARIDHGYQVHSLIQSLLASDVKENHVCKVQPLGVTKNAVFQTDLDCVAFEHLKADDLGLWVTTGTRRTYFWFTHTNPIRYATSVPASSEYFLLTRRYYVHKTYNRFHCIISDVSSVCASSFCYSSCIFHSFVLCMAKTAIRNANQWKNDLLQRFL